MDDTAGLSVEMELKLQVPPDRVAAVVAALESLPGGARPLHLEAAYLDTPDYDLSTAGLAWRLRHEGDQWVQTLKTSAAGTGFGRLEHNVPRGSTTHDAPGPDASLHAGTAAGDRLAVVLRSMHAPPDVRYRTDIDRLVARQHTHDGGVVELALDRGAIVAGDRRTDVRELEIELIEGSARDVLTAARRWSDDHALWPDSMHKARRGMLLERGVTELPVQRSTSAHLTTLITAIRGNCSAVTNGMGGTAHVTAVGHELQRVATVVGGDAANRFDSIGRSLVAAAADATLTRRDLVGAITDRTVVHAVLDLLELHP